jgi:hypothetical protein
MDKGVSIDLLRGAASPLDPPRRADDAFAVRHAFWTMLEWNLQRFICSG